MSNELIGILIALVAVGAGPGRAYPDHQPGAAAGHEPDASGNCGRT